MVQVANNLCRRITAAYDHLTLHTAVTVAFHRGRRMAYHGAGEQGIRRQCPVYLYNTPINYDIHSFAPGCMRHVVCDA